MGKTKPKTRTAPALSAQHSNLDVALIRQAVKSTSNFNEAARLIARVANLPSKLLSLFSPSFKLTVPNLQSTELFVAATSAPSPALLSLCVPSFSGSLRETRTDALIQEFDRCVSTFRELWGTGDDEVQGGVCVLVTKLAADPDLGSKFLEKGECRDEVI